MFPGVLVFPFPLRERFIGDTVMSIDVFSAINPQAGKLCAENADVAQTSFAPKKENPAGWDGRGFIGRLGIGGAWWPSKPISRPPS
jgi:hypothetical protein